MGGGLDGYRAVAYFVNVSTHFNEPRVISNNVCSGKSIKASQKGYSSGDADSAQGHLREKPQSSRPSG